MRPEPIQLTKPGLVLVEGRDELNFLRWALDQLRIDSIQILEFEGVPNLGSAVKAVAKTPGFSDVKVLAVMRNADADAKGAEASLRDALRRAGLPVPAGPVQLCDGDRLPFTAYLVVSCGDGGGALEDLCLVAAKVDSGIRVCVDGFVRCLENGPGFQRPKAKVGLQAMISAATPRAKLLGEAAKSGLFDLDNPAFGEIRALLELLARSV